MPRNNSQDHSTGDTITAVKLNDINEDLDDIYSEGSDRLRVVAAASGTALKIDIGAGNYFVGSSRGSYAGGTDISVTDSATNYVMIDTSGTIQISTTGWSDEYARLATVVCSGGSITSITLAKTDAYGGNIGSEVTWKTITASQSVVNGEGYVVNSASLVTLTLPTTAAVGQKFAIFGLGAGGWKIAQNASQKIVFDSLASTTGTGGYLESTSAGESVILECVVADGTWNVISFTGTPQFDGTDKKLSQEFIDAHFASDSAVNTGTSTNEIIAPQEAEKYYRPKMKVVEVSFTFNDIVQSDVTVAHGLGVPPRAIVASVDGVHMFSNSSYVGGVAGYDGSSWTQKVYNTDVNAYRNALLSYAPSASSDRSERSVSSADATNVTFSHAFSGSFAPTTVPCTLLFIY